MSKNFKRTNNIASIPFLLMVLSLVVISISCKKKEISVKEIRGVWITNVDSDVMYYPDSIRLAMKELSRQGFNVVFPVVFNKGLTLHPSKVMENYFGKEFSQDERARQQKIDPLAIMVVEAHRYGMEIIPWFEFGFSSSYNENGGHILRLKPEWAAKDKEGNLLKKNNFEWMNGIHPEVQQFLLDLIHEVIDSYDVDGVQGDDRLPAMPSQGGYSVFTRALYQKETGNTVPDNYADSAFMRWKADKLSAFAHRLYNEVKAKDSELIVSFSPSVYPWSYDEYLQDSPTWYAQQTVDLLIPQVYRYEIDRYKTTLDEVLQFHPNITSSTSKTWLASGILIKSGDKYNDYETYVKEAVRYNREKGVNGEVYFFYEGLDEKNGNLGDKLNVSEYRKKAELPYRNTDYRPEIIELEFEETSSIKALKGDYPLTKPGAYDVFIQSSGLSSFNWEIDAQALSGQNITPGETFDDAVHNLDRLGYKRSSGFFVTKPTRLNYTLTAQTDDLPGKSRIKVTILYNRLKSRMID